jgi:predicted DNA-binding protein (UPF0278 family)
VTLSRLRRGDYQLADIWGWYGEALYRYVFDSGRDFDLFVVGRELDAGVATGARSVGSWADDHGLQYVLDGQFSTLSTDRRAKPRRR